MTCTGGLANNCLTCDSPRFWNTVDKTCDNPCPLGSYGDTMDNVCKACFSLCTQCTGSVNGMC